MSPQGTQNNSDAKGERIAKVMAHAGLCSRRDAERWIEQGRVVVNGKTLESPAFTVTAKDKILVDNKPLLQEETVEPQLYIFHKPSGCLTTSKDPEGRKTIYDVLKTVLPEDAPRLIPIGRLDYNTEGLLLMTNDGGLSRYMELPKNKMKRRYRVRVFGTVSKDSLKQLEKGAKIDGVHYAPAKVILEEQGDKQGKSNQWLRITLTEGKNREVRKLCEHIGLQVSRLLREAYGPFSLGKLPRGAVKQVAQKDLHLALPEYFKP